MGHSAIAFIIVIGILVFIHELGHFLAARLCGVGVNVFSLGFGTKIFKKRFGRTEYCISAIPLGGYVKMMGEEPGETIPEADEKYSFTHKSLLKKSIIVAAGPVFNFLLAIFIFYVLYQFSGLYMAQPVVGKVLDDTPAAGAGILPGDIIKEINTQEIESFEDIAKIITTGEGKKLEIVVQRGSRYLGIVLSPVSKPGKNIFGEEIQKYVIGIVGNGESFHKSL
ncbi:MAG: RIP metalloprotease RseP, partial [Desulfobacula sp.]|nr:RIP metalloprotease RseP [Desulfobacula sp.]